MRIIAGPCQHESLEHSLMIAKHCKAIAEDNGFEYIFKASYDKANRSSQGTMRGVGLRNTVIDFVLMKEDIEGLKILTDVHESEHIEKIKHAVDVIQIPAFLCRQTDLVQTACRTDCVVNIKKGQFLAPWDMKGILTKTTEAKEVWVTERGTSFGYNTLVVDFTGIRWMLDNLACSVVMDATHAVQRPGAGQGTSSGNRDYAPYMAFAAASCGVKNFFMEVHDDPDNAPSDGPNMVKLNDFETIIKRLKKTIQSTEEV